MCVCQSCGSESGDNQTRTHTLIIELEVVGVVVGGGGGGHTHHIYHLFLLILKLRMFVLGEECFSVINRCVNGMGKSNRLTPFTSSDIDTHTGRRDNGQTLGRQVHRLRSRSS